MKDKLKNNKGITLVSLVVTIIILIILAGVSINMTLGEGGLITIAKRAKENMELAQMEEQEKLNELYMQIEKNEGITGEELDYDAIGKLNNFKKAIADYIEEAGGEKPDYTADTETFGEKIKGIVKEVTKDATATAENIEEGKTAWINGELITGIKSNFGEFSKNEIIKEINGTYASTSISNYTTFTYTLTEDDFNKKYNYYIFIAVASGANNWSYSKPNQMSPDYGSLGYYYNSWPAPGDVYHEFRIAIYPRENIKVGDTFSVCINGVYSISILGLK